MIPGKHNSRYTIASWNSKDPLLRILIAASRALERERERYGEGVGDYRQTEGVGEDKGRLRKKM